MKRSGRESQPKFIYRKVRKEREAGIFNLISVAIFAFFAVKFFDSYE